MLINTVSTQVFNLAPKHNAHTHKHKHLQIQNKSCNSFLFIVLSANHTSRGTQELGAEYTASLAIGRAPTSSASVWAEPKPALRNVDAVFRPLGVFHDFLYGDKPALRRELFFTVAAPLGFTPAGVQHLWKLNRSGLVVCRFIKSGRVRVRSWGIIWSRHGHGCNYLVSRIVGLSLTD